MKKILLSLLDLIYKKKCYFCSSSKSALKMCPKCYAELSYSNLQPNRIIKGINIYSCGIYEKTLQKLIRGLKYHKQRELAFYLAKFMYEYWSQIGDKRDFQVVPTPMHPKRIKKRKYNHMNLVVEEFCKLSGLTPNYELIKRVKDTKPQYKLTRLQRLENLKDAFQVDSSKDLNKPILILDDICTTGATFEEMIKTLKCLKSSAPSGTLLEKKDSVNIVCLAASSPYYSGIITKK